MPSMAPYTTHASTAAWPNIYAIAIAAIGQVTPYHYFLPAPAAWMRRGLFVYCRQTLAKEATDDAGTTTGAAEEVQPATDGGTILA
mgnify:CR=1 FL=1